MTECTRTPGPWGYGKLGNNADQWDIYDETGRTIGLSYQGESNAALMAAAPDLVDALRSLIQASLHGKTFERDSAITQARAVLSQPEIS